MTTYPPLLCQYPGCTQPRAKARGRLALLGLCRQHLDAHLNTCIEPGCTEPRYVTDYIRYPRCEAHAQAYWANSGRRHRAIAAGRPYVALTIADEQPQPEPEPPPEPMYPTMRIVVANYITQTVVVLSADVTDEQHMSTLRRDLRAQLEHERQIGTLVIEYP